MKNHFYMPYAGNKRLEVEDIEKTLNFDNITTIVEPFCGSCAISFYIASKHSGFKFILNDNNKFLNEMFEILKDDDKIIKFENEFNNLQIDLTKEKYLKIISGDNVMSWFIKNKIYCIRPGLFQLDYKIKNLNLKVIPIYSFFKNNDIKFYTGCGVECYKKYKDNTECLIILDPPYLATCNDFYFDSSVNIYEYLSLNDINKESAKIYLVLENIWIMKLLFRYNKILLEYDKLYQTSKKKTTHFIIGQ